MTYDDILTWQYAEGLDDKWLVAVGGNPSSEVKTLLEIKAIKDSAPTLQIHVLHKSLIEEPEPEWILLELQEEVAASLLPKSPTYHKEYNKFNATMEQMINLAQKAVRNNNFTVTNASHGFVAFETGMTWGSWSGVSGSVSIEEHEPNWFTVSGGGKQNTRGLQLAAFDFGEAKGKAEKVIATMKTLSSN